MIESKYKIKYCLFAIIVCVSCSIDSSKEKKNSRYFYGEIDQADIEIVNYYLDSLNN